MLSDYLPALILIIGFIFIAPLSWKEENSYIACFIKFWFYVLPSMVFYGGVIFCGVGLIFAIVGLFDSNYLIVTFLYIYVPFIEYISKLINTKYNNILKTL